MPAIDAYHFGRMTIKGFHYTTDLVILPSGKIVEHWIRKSGHLLIASDISQLIKAAPERIIIGTGTSGRMQVGQSLLTQLTTMGIKLDIHSCKKAVKKYNQIITTDTPAGACFHLTC